MNRIEYAKTGYGTCNVKNLKREYWKKFQCPACEKPSHGDREGKLISEGSLRVGSMHPSTCTKISYWQWKHLTCWRVPEAVFAELPDDLDDKPAVLEALRRLSKKGYQGPLALDETLSEESLQEVVAWVTDKANWSNHNVEGVCIRKGKTDKCIPAPKKKKAAKRKPKAPAGDDLPFTPERKKPKPEPKPEPEPEPKAAEDAAIIIE